MTALISGECEIGFMGSEASIYVYNQGAEDYVLTAQLTTGPYFLVSRDMNEEFKWENIKEDCTWRKKGRHASDGIRIYTEETGD